MTANNDTELKPCPFCGGKAEQSIYLGDPKVSCTDCGIFYLSPDAVKDWNTRAASGQGNQEALESLGYARRCINNVISAGPMGSTTFEQGVSARDYIDQAISALTTPSEPTISLPQLKAICEGMKKTPYTPDEMAADYFDPTEDRYASGCNDTLDQVYEAAEKEAR